MPALKYLFEAHFSDGTVIRQSPEDVSTTSPGKSAFYDVQQRLGDVVNFVLTDGTNRFLVDLRDGHFESNAIRFFPLDPETRIPDGTTFRLIYFRRHKVDFNIGYEEIGHAVKYYFGWQATIDGRNHKQTIYLD